MPMRSFNTLSYFHFRLIQNIKIFLFKIQNPMKDKLYDNADSFAMSFDEEWENIECEDIPLKIDKVFELLADRSL